MLLPLSRYAEGVELISAAMSQVSCGDPREIGNLASPLVSEKQREAVRPGRSDR